MNKGNKIDQMED